MVGDEDALRLSRGGTKWYMLLSLAGINVFLGPLTLPWECPLPTKLPRIISSVLLKSLRIEEPS